MPSADVMPPAGWMTSPWVLGPAAFVLWIVVLLFVRRVLLRALRRFAERTASTWDDVVINALRAPILIAILASGVVVLGRILPLGPEIDQALNVLLAAALPLALVLLADRLVAGSLDRVATRSPSIAGVRGLIQASLRGLIIGIGLLIFLDSIGISITPILASLGVGSLAVALALQDTLANMFAGVYMVTGKPLEPGHMVRLESGEEGTVVRVGLRNTWIRTLPNNMVIVPNTKLASSTLTNYSLLDPEMAVLVNVGVHYGSDLDHVERVTLDVARESQRTVPGAVAEFEPMVRFHTFADSSIDLTVVLRVREFGATPLIKHDLVKRLHARYRKEGIVIPFPIRTLELPAGFPPRVEGFARPPETRGHAS